MGVFRRIFVSVLCCLLCLPVFGGNSTGAFVMGRVTAKDSGGGLSGANIKVKNDTAELATCASDDKGSFKCEIPKEVVEGTTKLIVQVSLDGYKESEVNSEIDIVDGEMKDVLVNVELESQQAGDDSKPDSDKIRDLEDKYQSAKEKEQSLANRMVSGVSMAATGIGGMELAQGLAEKSADADADRDMQQYMSTFMCRVGDQKYSGGTKGIETGGANSLISLYQEYVELASDLSERKTALGKKPGIEADVILDKASTGLYDDVGTGIQNGTYASLYRAKTGNQEDSDALSDAASTTSKRIKGGAIAAGAGVVVGVVGNSLINGKLGELIKDAKSKTANSKENKSAISELKKGLKSTGMTNVDKLDFSNLDLSALSGKMKDMDWSSVMDKYKGQDATGVISTTNAASLIGSLTSVFNNK